MMWPYGNLGWGEWLGMLVSMLLFWGLISVLVIVLVRTLFTRDRPAAGGRVEPPPSAEDILGQRFARGEIDADEYHARLEVLRGSGNPSPFGKR